VLTLIKNMINLKYKLQILNEGLSEANLDLESTQYTLKEYIESQALNDPSFFRWLFSENFDNDYDNDLSEYQREEYQNLLNSI
jgi:hypothetical protein